MALIYGSDGRVIGDSGGGGGGGGGGGDDDNILNLVSKWGKFIGLPTGLGEVGLDAHAKLEQGGLKANAMIGALAMLESRGGKLAELFFKIFKKAGGEIKSWVDGIQGLEVASLSYGELGSLTPLSTGESMAGRGAGIDFG